MKTFTLGEELMYDLLKPTFNVVAFIVAALL